jgi:chromosome segregation ATPase
MGKPNLRIAGEAPPRTPEREQLAEAIARRDTATKQLARIQAAHERASDTVYELKDGVDKAIATLNEAKAGEGSYLAAVALGEADVALSPVKTAAANVEQANDQLGTARRTRAALEAEIKVVERELMFADMALDERIADAVRADPAVRQLVTDFEVASKTYAELRQAMTAVRCEWLPDASRSWDSIRNWPEMPTVATWKAALAALRENADAPLPS